VTEPETERPPRLFHFRVSHFNEKVRWALDHKSWPHERISLVPGFHVARIRPMTGQNAVPVLVLDGEVLFDSTRIIAELERRRPDPPLYPRDPTLRERALAIEEHFDEKVAPDLRRLFWSTYIDDGAACARMSTDGFGAATRASFRAAFPAMRPLFVRNMGLAKARVARAHERLGAHLDRLEAEIGPSGYLVGDSFTIADLTAAAVMTAILRPPEFPYALPEPWPEALVALRASILDRPGSRWVLDTYRRHRGISHEV
jgi:glutathione S-transferase